jgi:hypothetical protein
MCLQRIICIKDANQLQLPRQLPVSLQHIFVAFKHNSIDAKALLNEQAINIPINSSHVVDKHLELVHIYHLVAVGISRFNKLGDLLTSNTNAFQSQSVKNFTWCQETIAIAIKILE